MHLYRARERQVQERCFQTRDSLHHNANMCYRFTTSGLSGTGATHRSQRVKSKMEECGSSRFYCSFLWMQMLCIMGTLRPLLKGVKNKKIKKCWQVDIEAAAHWSEVQIRTRKVMSCLKWTVAV